MSNEVKAYLKMSNKLKLTLGLFMTQEQLDRYCLEKGIQPNDIMTVVITIIKENDNHE